VLHESGTYVKFTQAGAYGVIWNLRTRRASIRCSRFADLTNLRCRGNCCFRRGLNVNENALAKLVVTVVVLISLAFCIKEERAERYQRACGVDCPTDFSASRK
jgi:hypothetical protein